MESEVLSSETASSVSSSSHSNPVVVIPQHLEVVISARSLAKKIQEVVAALASRSGVLRESFMQTACYLERILPVVLEIQNNGNGNEPAETCDALTAAGRDVDSVGRLAAEFNGKSEIFMLTQVASVSAQLEEITHRLHRSLAQLPPSAVHGDPDILSAVASISCDLASATFCVKETDGHIARFLRTDSTTSVNSANTDSDNSYSSHNQKQHTELLLNIAHSVGIENAQSNPNALKTQIELLRKDLRSTSSQGYNLHMMDHLGTIVDRWVQDKNRLTNTATTSTTSTGTSTSAATSSSLASFEIKRVEPVYESFVCPLTKQLMRDPVTLEISGQTYEKFAIERWLKECSEQGRPPVCPITGKQLEAGTELKPSIALRKTIEEWVSRNEIVRIENAKILISAKGSGQDILHSLKDLQLLCSENRANKQKVGASGLISPIVACLSKNEESIRCAAFTTLRIVAEDNDYNKEAIGETDALRNCVKCFYRNQPKESEEALLLLYELSKSISLCEKIGQINGGILMLVGMTSAQSENTTLVLEKAELTLVNLEQCEMNIKQMAEFGRLLPLLKCMVQGEEEERLEMARCLADLVPSDGGKAEAAAVGAKMLVEMLDSGYMAGRESALKILLQLSTLEANGLVLVDAGILPPLIRDLLSIGVNHLPTRLKEVCASILANVVNSGVNIESTPVNDEGDSLTSESIIHSLLHLVSNTGPAIEMKLLQVLVALASMKSPQVVKNVVLSIKSAGATMSLMQFLEAPQKELRVNAMKLLCCLCPYMGPELVDSVQSTTGLLGTLVKLLGNAGVSDEQAAAAGFLAKLPVSESHLTRALFEEGALPLAVVRIGELQSGGGGGGVRMGANAKFLTTFREGLVGVLARFTLISDEPRVLDAARQHELTNLFVSLLSGTPVAGGLSSTSEIQRLSAGALENLSNRSKQLSVVPISKHSNNGGCSSLCKSLLPCLKPAPQPLVELCPIHFGVCSSQNTFCLLKAGAVVPLVDCLDSTNLGVAEAALGALSTLLRDGVNVNNGIQILRQNEAVHPIFNILCVPKTESLRQRALWVVERMLRNSDIARAVSTDAKVHTAIIEAFRHSNTNTRHIAEAALAHLNKIPQYSGVFQKLR